MKRVLVVLTALMVVMAGLAALDSSSADAGLFNRNKCRRTCKTVCCTPTPCCQTVSYCAPAPEPCGCSAAAPCGCEAQTCSCCLTRREARKARRAGCCTTCSTCSTCSSCGCAASAPCGCSGTVIEGCTSCGGGTTIVPSDGSAPQAAPEAAPEAPSGDSTT